MWRILSDFDWYVYFPHQAVRCPIEDMAVELSEGDATKADFLLCLKRNLVNLFRFFLGLISMLSFIVSLISSASLENATHAGKSFVIVEL